MAHLVRLLALGIAAGAAAQDPLPGLVPRIEFGSIDWLHDFEAARRTAVTRERDLLMLFQEVPG